MTDDPEAGARFLGPELPSLWRRLSEQEARDYARVAGLSPEQSVGWADALIGPYETARAIEAGQTLEVAIAARQARRQATEPARAEVRKLDRSGVAAVEAWVAQGFSTDDRERWLWRGPVASIEVGTDDHLVLEVGAHILKVTPQEAAGWRDVGFDAESAAPWLLTGLGPPEAAEQASRNATPASFVSSLAQTDPDRIITWGDSGDQVQLGLLTDFQLGAKLADELRTMLSCSTWRELVDAVGRDAVEAEFDTWLDDLWGDLGTGGDRPPDWIPKEDLDLGRMDWITEQSRISDPSWLNLPASVVDLATGAGSPVSGDFVWWTKEAVPDACRAARLEGYAFVRCQHLVEIALRSG